MIGNHIFSHLERLGIIALVAYGSEAAKSTSSGFMDLHFDRLYEQDGGIVISLAHYFEQCGDLCCDPDMEIRVDLTNRVAEALSFQQAIPPVYSRVHGDDGSVNPKLQTALNRFLAGWLANCIAQGHGFKTEGGA